MTKTPLLLRLLAASVILTACGPRTSPPNPNAEIQRAVAATLAALPSPAPAATSHPLPTSTPFSLDGLFCEYQFCIGHPPEMAFFDVSAQQNPIAPSTYAQGLMITYNASLVIQLIWQYAPGATDPIFLMDLILEDGLDAPTGTYGLRLINNLNVLSSPITTTVAPLHPFGGVAGWVCGDRAFAWKVYSPQDGTAEALLQEALARFRCE